MKTSASNILTPDYAGSKTSSGRSASFMSFGAGDPG